MRKAVNKRQQAERLAREIARWQKILAPRLPDIEPHDLHLILWSVLMRKYGGQRRFLMRRLAGGGYVC